MELIMSKNIKILCSRASELLIQIERLKIAYKQLDEYESVLVNYPEEIQAYGLTFVDTFDGKNTRWKSVSFKQYQLMHIKQTSPHIFKVKKSKNRK